MEHMRILAMHFSMNPGPVNMLHCDQNLRSVIKKSVVTYFEPRPPMLQPKVVLLGLLLLVSFRTQS